MKINKLTASFGKLENASLELKDGLNVISAPNESGKSTWCAFIRAMFYGIDTSERAKGGYLPDKQKYAPWSGAPMQGSMDITVGGKDVTLSRATSGKLGLMRDFSAVYTGTSVPVDGLNGTNAGEALLGISKDVFNRSVFVEQGAVAVSGSPELEKRIASIVSTGEETGSYSEANDRLRAWQRKRRFNRIGMIPEFDASLTAAESRMAYLSSVGRDAAEFSEKLADANGRCAELEEALKAAKLRYQKQAHETLTNALSELEGKLSEKQQLCAELEDALRCDTDSRQRAAMQELNDSCARLEAEYAAKKAECSELEQDVADMRKRQRKDALDKLNLSRAELNSCLAEKNAAADALISARGKLAENAYSSDDNDAVIAKLNSSAEAAEALDAEAAGKSVVSPVPTVAAFVLFAAAVVLAVLKLDIIFAACAAVFLAIAVFLLVKLLKAKKALSAALKKRDAILASLQADSPEALRAAARELAALCEAVSAAEQRDRMARAAYDQKQTHQAFLEQSALNELDFAAGDSEGARLGRELAAKKDALQALADSLASLKGRIAAFGEGGFAVSENGALSSELAAARAETAELSARLANLKGRIASTDYPRPVTAEPDASSPVPEIAQLSRELIEARDIAKQLTAHCAALRGKMSAMGDPLVISSEIENMREEKAQLEGEYEALELAIGALREADAEIQSRFSPALGKAAAEYMSAVTAGRYDEILVNRDFSVATHALGDTLRRDSSYLSAGTLDLMYLCVRLAVCELALPDGEPCPLIIDDALANLDDTRYAEVINALSEIANTRQVILFTCREK